MSTVSPIVMKDQRVMHMKMFVLSNSLLNLLETAQTSNLQNNSERLLLMRYYQEITYKCVEVFDLAYSYWGTVPSKAVHTVIFLDDTKFAHYFKQFTNILQSKATDKQSSTASGSSRSGISQADEKLEGNNNAFKAFQEAIPELIQLIRSAPNLVMVVKRWGYKYVKPTSRIMYREEDDTFHEEFFRDPPVEEGDESVDSVVEI